MTSTKPASHSRLTQVDALRGLAALIVVFFHFTTRYQELFKPADELWLSVPWGHYGVNLFFIISGFVIFMTLERSRRPMDFVVSRFSRLYPAYWCAVALTFGITNLLGLPLKMVDAATALMNLPMFHGLFGVTHVDGVYWTLEVELLFYAGMFAVFVSGRLNKVHLFVVALLGLRVAYSAAAAFWGVDLPWTIWRLLILQHLPWFGLGMAIYSLTKIRHGGHDSARLPVAAAVAGFVALLAGGTLLMAALYVALGLTVFAAAGGRLRLLEHPVLVWLGGISYPLYLLHENIGWAVILQGVRLGMDRHLAVLVALAFVLLLSHAVSRGVELPAMRGIRAWHKRRSGQVRAEGA